MAQKWNTVKDKNGNTFVKTGSNYWPVLGKGNGLSYAGESTATAPKPAKATAAGGTQAAAPAQPTAAAAPAASGAYERLMQVYGAALDAQRAQRRAAYEAAVHEQQQLYEQNAAKVNGAADKALREAYINKMQTQRTLGQQMAAQGLNGGYSETTAAGVQNNYGNARNELETERSGQLNDLNITLQNNIAAARKILDTGNAGDYAQYQTNMADLYANNPVQTMSLEQNGAGIGNSGATLYQLYQQMVAGGATPTEAMSYLKKSGHDLSQLFAGQ